MKILASSARILAVGLVALSLSQRVGVPQQQPPQPVQNPGSAAPQTSGQLGDPKSKIDMPSPFGNTEEKQAILRNDERQRRLVSDSERLLSLATQLHEDVTKTDKHILSVDVVRRADEIEKLAHNVKERMKG